LPKLGIAVGVIVAFLELPIALQAVVLLVEQLCNSDIADRMMLLAQFGGQRPCALADPPQGRFRIATGSALNQAIQRYHQARIRFREVLASRTWTANVPCHRAVSCFDFANALGDCLPGQATSTVDRRHSAITQSNGFVGRHNTPGTLIQESPNGLKLLPQHRNRTHGQLSYHISPVVETFIYYHRLSAISSRVSGKRRSIPGMSSVKVGFLSRCTRSPMGSFKAAA